jgi:hypothetical protein
MNFARQQVPGSRVLALMVLLAPLIRAWPYLFHK